jgi:hypothetical protein
MSYALTGLGRAAIGLGAARAHFLEASQRARKADEGGIALLALGGTAEFFADRGAAKQAYELATFVANHHLITEL